eukprot:TRINITY_DN50_c0_g1_i8.p3 TRINITY_DN50_c0_g1~~TRINITY_DN50_c0_g1_i8.p3  ORF type:complete len:112 (-),score=1.40 TRINITY_DN50_c0_g1_i8:177-512(-)
MGDFEEALGRGSPRVHNSLGYPLPVERRKLLYQMVVLQQHRPSRANGERGSVIPDGGALVGRQVRSVEGARRTVLVRIHGCTEGLKMARRNESLRVGEQLGKLGGVLIALR